MSNSVALNSEANHYCSLHRSVAICILKKVYFFLTPLIFVIDLHYYKASNGQNILHTQVGETIASKTNKIVLFVVEYSIYPCLYGSLHDALN
jgi:hypothetical protein